MTNPIPLYRKLASLVQAVHTCRERDSGEWGAKHTARIEEYASAYLPSGSGFDSGTTVDVDASKPDRLVLRTSFHHMNDGGMYDGWSDHDVIVTPSLVFGFLLRVTGRDRNDIKNYIGDAFQDALEADVSAMDAVSRSV